VAYVGNTPSRGQWRKLTDISGSFNGVTTTFTTSVPPGTSDYYVTAGSASQLIISVGGVIKEPNVDYTVSTYSITFTTAPAAGLSFFGVLCGDALNVNTPADGSVTTAKLSSNLTVDLASGTAASPSLTFDSNTGLYSPGEDQVGITTGGTGRMFIDSSGRLLVGTASAAYSGANANLQLIHADGPDVIIARNQTTLAAGQTLGRIMFYGNDSDGTYERCAVIEAAADLDHGTGDKPSRLVFSTTADGASSPTERMRIRNDGSTSLYSSTSVIELRSAAAAGGALEVLNGYHSATSTSTGTRSVLIATNGNIQNTNNSYAGISDVKLKENIVDAGSQWDDLRALQVRKYNFKEETGHQTFTQIGLIAQEVELVSPGLVNESPDRDAEGNDLGTVTKSVNYSVLYMKAVKALQEAMERIETLEASNADLLARVSALESA
jgi:hypothetical protein